MKDEIKEILDNLEDAGFMYKRISPEEIKKILDYITNLQEENEKIKKYYNDNVNMYEDLIIKYNTIERCYQLNKLRNKKSIEYIKEDKENLYKYTPEKGFRLVGDEVE